MYRSTAASLAHGLSRFHASFGQLILHIILTLFSVISFFPFVWMAFGSFKHFKELTASASLLPQVWTLDNYVEIVNQVSFLSAFRNSVIVSLVTTASVLITSSAAGYVFAVYRFPGKEVLFSLFISTLMVPFSVILVPLYIFVVDIGAVDRLSGVVLPGLWSTFGIFLMRQFLEGIPSELVQSARLDGASEWRVFLQIILPLSGSPLAALAILNFLWSWDSFLWPSIVLSSPGHVTIPVLLAGLQALYWTRYDLWSAGSMLTVVPVMIIYAFASRQFIRSIALTGLKI